jgi:opacity protein-like surface antigen
MRLVRVALSALGGVVLATSSALAADIAAVPPPPLWGFYFGGGVCYDWADFDIDKNIYKKKFVGYGDNYQPIFEQKLKHTFDLFDISAEAPCATAQIGWDYQLDPLFVVGIFASYDWQLEEKRGDVTKEIYTYHGPKTITLATASIGDIATIGGRAGVLVQPDMLVYFLLGYSWSNASFQVFPPWGPGASGGVSGPTVGFGLEKFIAANWSLRGELRYTDFGKLSTGLHKIPYTPYSWEKTARITDTSVRVVLTWRP